MITTSKNTPQKSSDLQWQTVERFLETYWGGLNSRIYFNDVLIDEVVHLSYELSQSVRPIYPYCSYVYSILLRGVRQVTGNFTINFKKDKYLIERLSQIDTRNSINRNIPPEDPPLTNPGIESIINNDQSRRIKEGLTNPFDYIGSIFGSDPVRDKDKRPMTNTDRDKIVVTAETAKKARFGLATSNTLLADNELDTPVNSLLDIQRILGKGRLDISIEFSTTNDLENQANERRTRGDLEPPLNRTEVAVNTKRKIVGVSLIGNSFVVDDSGKPIMDQYQFIAQDVV